MQNLPSHVNNLRLISPQGVKKRSFASSPSTLGSIRKQTSTNCTACFPSTQMGQPLPRHEPSYQDVNTFLERDAFQWEVLTCTMQGQDHSFRHVYIQTPYLNWPLTMDRQNKSPVYPQALWARIQSWFCSPSKLEQKSLYLVYPLYIQIGALQWY